MEAYHSWRYTKGAGGTEGQTCAGESELARDLLR